MKFLSLITMSHFGGEIDVAYLVNQVTQIQSISLFGLLRHSVSLLDAFDNVFLIQFWSPPFTHLLALKDCNEAVL